MRKTLEIKNIFCRYGNTPVLNDISFSVNQNQVCALLGESGSGKTTLLRSIAGFEKPINGEIILNEKPVFNSQLFIHPEKRNIGLVFQEYALFPHLTVIKNVAFGMKDKSRALEYLKLLSIEDLSQRYPHQLSGGQQQRAAIARSLAANPALLMLDEPFSNLDESLKRTVRHELKKVFSENNTTCLLVTHDMNDALDMADYMVILHNGKVEQQGTPYELYNAPASVYVAQLFGPVNVLNAAIASVLSKGQMQTRALVRPEKLTLSTQPGEARVLHSHFKGLQYEIHLLYHNQNLVAFYNQPLNPGTDVTITCLPNDILPLHE